MMTFSGLRRDIKTHIPFTGNKISVRADLMNTFWTKISAQVNEASFTRNSDKKVLHYVRFELGTVDILISLIESPNGRSFISYKWPRSVGGSDTRDSVQPSYGSYNYYPI